LLENQPQLGSPPARGSGQPVIRASAALLKKPSDQLIADEAKAVASASENHTNVGACEVVPFKEERLAADLGEGIGEAVAIVQAGAMPSFAIHPVGDSCGICLVGIDADKVNCGAMQPQI
jgi:hypothetical protein